MQINFESGDGNMMMLVTQVSKLIATHSDLIIQQMMMNHFFFFQILMNPVEVQCRPLDEDMIMLL